MGSPAGEGTLPLQPTERHHTRVYLYIRGAMNRACGGGQVAEDQICFPPGAGPDTAEVTTSVIFTGRPITRHRRSSRLAGGPAALFWDAASCRVLPVVEDVFRGLIGAGV